MDDSRVQLTPVYGGIEAGGTKWVCAIGTSPNDVRAITRFPTMTPAETLDRAVTFFRTYDAPLNAVGIASFGPVDVQPSSPTWGFITTTPKPGWRSTNVAGTLGRALGVPINIDTDVNGAALAEHRWGAARGLDTFLYLTIGTGIGGGGMAGGALMHGLLHPEMGHIFVPHDRAADPFDGICPFHGDCLEGLASGPAIQRRWNQPAHTLPADHPAWQLQAQYLAVALANLICTVSPQRIIMGGGVMEQPHLWPLMRADVQRVLNGYVHAPALLDRIDAYIVPPALGGRAGVFGALALAAHAGGVAVG